MGRKTYVFRRGDVFWFRRRVPRPFDKLLGTVHLARSLRTTDPELAGRLARRLTAEIDEAFLQVEDGTVTGKTEIQALMQTVITSVLERDELRRQARAPHDNKTAKRKASFYQGLAGFYRMMLKENDQVSASAHLEAIGTISNITSPDQIRPALRAVKQAHLLNAEREMGLYREDAGLLPVDANLQAPKIVAAPSGPSISETIDACATEMTLTKTWTKKTELQSRQSARLLIELLGDLPIGTIEKSDAVRFKQAVAKLPKDHGKSADTRGKTLPETLAIMANVSDRATICPRTVNRHLTSLLVLFDWAKRHGHTTGDNPFAGLLMPKGKHATGERGMFSDQEIKRIFLSPVWAGCRSKGRRSEPGANIIKDSKFWVPLIAAFSGARLEEICQLHVGDDLLPANSSGLR